jgi:transposase
MDTAEKLAPDVGTAAACRAMGVSRATVYRRRNRQPTSGETRCKNRQQPRALNNEERQSVLGVLHSDPHIDKSPAAVYAELLDQSTGSIIQGP